jgi:hypothetical protein
MTRLTPQREASNGSSQRKAYSREFYAERITTAWNRTLRNIIRAGTWLIAAKDGPNKLRHGEFTAMIEHDLPFGERVAQRLMAIARHPILANPTHESVLPRSYITLYEMTKLPHDQLEEMLRYRVITIDTGRQQVAEIVKQCADDGNYWLRSVSEAFGTMIDFMARRKVAEQVPELVQALYEMRDGRGRRVSDYLPELAAWFKKLDGNIKAGQPEMRSLARDHERERHDRLAERNKPISAKERRRRQNARERMHELNYGAEHPKPNARPRFAFGSHQAEPVDCAA